MALMMSQVRAAMARQLGVALGSETQIATAPDQLTPPCLFLGLPELVEYNLASRRGLDKMDFPVYGLLPRTHDQAAVDQADLWLSGDGPNSVRAILENDTTLGEACQTLVVRDAVSELFGDLTAIHWTVEVFG